MLLCLSYRVFYDGFQYDIACKPLGLLPGKPLGLLPCRPLGLLTTGLYCRNQSPTSNINVSHEVFPWCNLE